MICSPPAKGSTLDQSPRYASTTSARTHHNARMIDPKEHDEPDWESPLHLTLSPALLIHSLLASAATVHTGTESCVDETLVVSNLIALERESGNYVRLTEQEFYAEDEPEVLLHDWTVEIGIGRILTTGHWQAVQGASLLDWEWSASQAQDAFERACVLVGRRVRRGLVVEEPATPEPPPRASRH